MNLTYHHILVVPPTPIMKVLQHLEHCTHTYRNHLELSNNPTDPFFQDYSFKTLK